MLKCKFKVTLTKKTLTKKYGRIYPAVGTKSTIQYDPHCIGLGNDNKSSYKYMSHIYVFAVFPNNLRLDP